MDDPSPHHRQAYKDALKQQRLAADPRATRLVSANAGSGKTRVLVSRVSRLLLEGVKPDKILCLTYTKAAASEMQSRLFARLGEWSIMDEKKLRETLQDLVGDETSRYDKAALRDARQLFARALETPDGLKVQTIHAFCGHILSRFPIEAGILPGFEVMDERDHFNLQKEVNDRILQTAWEAPDGELAKAINLLSSHKSNVGLIPIMNWIAHSGPKITSWISKGGTKALAKFLGLSPDISLAQLKAQAWQAAPRLELTQAAEGLLNSEKPKEIEYGRRLSEALVTPDASEAFDLYASFVFKKNELAVFTQICTQAAGPAAIALFDRWNKAETAEMIRMAQVAKQIKSFACLELSGAILTVAEAFNHYYSKAKLRIRKLDFSDQIIRVRDLLIRKEVSEWVKYKLDGGIDHILVDEAQDTAPMQWEIIDALRDNFIGRDEDELKTFFAVGDEKQSIYSFQGARPEIFLKTVSDYQAEPDALPIQMQMSFRSASEILTLVDQVFSKADINLFDKGLREGSTLPIKHQAYWEHLGEVELWPLAPHPDVPDEEIPWDTRPVNAPNQASSREQLAQHIATQVKRWLDDKIPVFDREQRLYRPVRAEDILILVRRRTHFFDALIRHLKTMDIPVAGADRLVLKDAMIVKDLMSLSRFVLLPSDDLSLAETLKSPFFALSDDELFHMAYGREGSLWEALQAQTDPKAMSITAILKDIQNAARLYAPYEFFSRVLDFQISHNETQQAVSLLKKAYQRLGMEAKEALEAFLAKALAHQRRSAPSLQAFVRDFEHDEQDIKRDLDAGQNEVRVMTVHGAKGLEAPIIILPDTSQGPSMRGESGLVEWDKGYVYIPNKKSVPARFEEIVKAANSRLIEEYMRLLYVAMTRAETRLVICGFATGRRSGQPYERGSWYEIVKSAMEDVETTTIETPFGEGLRFGHISDEAISYSSSVEDIRHDLPDWIYHPASSLYLTQYQPLQPSKLSTSIENGDYISPPVRSPLGTRKNRFQRGNIIHKLLEILPDAPVDRRKPIMEAYLKPYENMSEEEKHILQQEVLGVLDNPQFAKIFALGSRAEVSLAGRPSAFDGKLFLNAQIDRLAVTDKDVFIVDYKSNRSPPQDQDGVALAYWEQMAAYRAMLADIYPDKKIICALLWTDGPHLMILDSERLDAVLTRLVAIPT